MTTGSTAPSTPEQLLELAAAGNGAAMNRLLGKLAPAIRACLRRFALCEADIDDLAQEVLLKVWRHFKTFRGESSLTSWAWAIASNTARNHIAAQKRQPLMVDRNDSSQELEPVAPSLRTEGADRECEAQQCLHRLGAEVQSMPVVFQAVLNLRYENGLGYSAIAEQLHIPVGTVRSRLHRARQMLALVGGNVTVAEGTEGLVNRAQRRHRSTV